MAQAHEGRWLSEFSITDCPHADRMARFRADFGQRFIVTVDAEEEFDWSRPLTREGFGLDHVPRLEKFQEFCEGRGVVPLYLVDYPLATSPRAGEILRGPIAAGKAEVGVQLHPWVNPPFDEDISEFNSFAGNLPEALEREKFKRLRDAIERNFGEAPLAYRAGRYGVGPNTVQILQDMGIAVDTSARARFDYSSTGGANFRDLPIKPWWLDKAQRVMEMPLTTVFWGPLGRFGPWLYPRLWRVPRLRGALVRGIEVAVRDRLPILVFSFHSPSLATGYTPYVRNEDELDQFYEWWRTAFDVLARHGVRPTSIREIMNAVDLASPPIAS